MRGSSVKGGCMPPPPTFKTMDTSDEKRKVAASPAAPSSKTLTRMNSNSSNGSCKFLSFVGSSCGHHASYTFYKAAKYLNKSGQTKIISLGEFFFVKIWHDADIISIGELQLLWEDKNSNQILSSVRLYFLPEYTPDGRMHYHGKDELIAVSEKAVLRLTDLLDWIANPKDVHWDHGLLGVCDADVKQMPPSVQNFDRGLNAKFYPGFADFLSDVKKEKNVIGRDEGGDVTDIDDVAVVVLSNPQYSRYRAVLKRVAGKENEWMHNSLITALGGFTTQTRNTRVLFCRDVFDYPELEEHPFLCNHLAPKLKGRPRKRAKVTRPGSPGSESGSSESSVATSVSTSISSSAKNSPRNGVRKDLLSILSQKNTKDESEFLKKLVHFMEKRNTPIERPPMLGYKQIDLHLFYEKVKKVGGYEGCTQKKTWKTIYDDLGGNPSNTSAATCTRKHYEKFLLPFERHLRGQGEKRKLRDFENNSDHKDRSSSPSTHDDEDDKSDTSLVNLVKSRKDDSDELEDSLKEEKPDIKELQDGHKRSRECSSPSENLVKNMSTGLQSLMGNKPDSQMKIDPDGKRLQIDDLIIIPSNLHSPPEGRTALQSLAAIASKYQGASQPQDSSSPKKARYEEKMAGQPLPATSPGSSLGLKPGDLGASFGLTALQQQSLFAALNPALLAGTWPAGLSLPGSKPSTSSKVPTSGSSSSSSSAMNSALALAAAAAAAGLQNFQLGSDPSGKSASDSYSQLLQFYEKQLKGTSNTSSITPSERSKVSPATPTGVNGSKKDSSSTATNQVSKEKDRHKVCKPPPETKRPPRLIQTPCAFVQTNHIYTNPMAELTKAKEAVAAASAVSGGGSSLSNNNNLSAVFEVPVKRSGSSGGSSHSHHHPILDLSSGKRSMPKSEPTHGLLNLKKESSLLAYPNAPVSASANMMDLTPKRESASKSPHPLGFSASLPIASPGIKQELKPSLFSAESLLSKTSPSSTKSSAFSSSLQHSMSDLVKLSASQERNKQHESLSRMSPATSVSSMAMPRTSPAPRSSPFGSSQSPMSSGADKSRSSPWHMHSSQVPQQKPAIPVSPVVRESDQSKKDPSGFSPFQTALLGLGYPAITTSSGLQLPMSLPQSSYSMSPSSNSLAASQQSLAAAAAANPYLALMSMSGVGGMPPLPGTPGHPKSLAGFTPHLMDPATSAYYAALYSQQMYGLSPYLGLGSGLRPGMGSPGASSNNSSATAAAMAAAAAGLDPLQASALQAMLSRGSGAAPSPSSAFSSGFPGGLGIPGYPPFPPHGRKD